MNIKKNNLSKKSIRQNLSNILELPKEIMLNLPFISIIGKEELRLENYKGIIEYSLECIRLNTSCGVLKLEGKNLVLKQITSENIVVNGVINKLEYIL